MMREGSKVSYTGADADGLSLGDQGRVLSVSDHTVHVMWTSGQLAHQITPVYEYDLAKQGTRVSMADGLDDSLDVGGLVFFSVRRAYDEGGEAAVLNEMAEAGHLASFSDIAEEALLTVAGRIRNDPSFMSVIADLDEEEAESVLRMASACLIRDAFGEEPS